MWRRVIVLTISFCLGTRQLTMSDLDMAVGGFLESASTSQRRDSSHLLLPMPAHCKHLRKSVIMAGSLLGAATTVKSGISASVAPTPAYTSLFTFSDRCLQLASR